MSEDAGSMTPKKEPTASEAMFFFAIVKHTRNKADIDWDAVAVEQNFKNAEVAKVRFGQVKRKLGISSTAETPGSSAARSTAKKGAAAAAAAVAAGAAAGTPTKVKKNTGRAGAKGQGQGRGRGRAKKPEPVLKGEDVDSDDAETVKAEPLDPAEQFERDMQAMVNEDDPF